MTSPARNSNERSRPSSEVKASDTEVITSPSKSLSPVLSDDSLSSKSVSVYQVFLLLLLVGVFLFIDFY